MEEGFARKIARRAVARREARFVRIVKFIVRHTNRAETEIFPITVPIYGFDETIMGMTNTLPSMYLFIFFYK